MSPELAQVIAGFTLTLLSVVLLAPLATRVGLVDRPDARKHHAGEVPLIGGIAIFIALALGGLFWGDARVSLLSINQRDSFWVFLSGGLVLVVMGSLDDRFKLGVLVRVLTEFAVALIVIEGLALRVGNLGDLVGLGTIQLPPEVAYPFTIIAIFGIVNAFNMLDGLDGLLASLVLASLLSFHLITGTYPGMVSLFLGSALTAFLISNLALSPWIPKAFLGDAGSKLLGFIVVCLILAAATEQVGGVKLVKPVAALYIVALPLFDMVFVTLRRLIQGVSPFAADRGHIHHALLALGFSKRITLLLVLVAALSLSGLGVALQQANASEPIQMATFLGLFVMYSVFMSTVWRVVNRISQKTT